MRKGGNVLQELEGRTVLVTGAGKSLGREIALSLAKLGANLVINYNTSMKGAEEVCEKISQLGNKIITIQTDVSDSIAVKKMFQKINSELGTVDVLVNNAAVNIDSTVRKMDDETWNRVVDVNLTGTFHCAREAILAMREQQWGRIINMSSVTGATGAFGAANYAAAKAGIIGFTKSLAKEVAKYEITVNAIAPGYLNIGMGENLPEKLRSDILELIPMGRYGRPEEVTSVIGFLASRDASYITGQVIHVNGGYFM